MTSFIQDALAAEPLSAAEVAARFGGRGPPPPLRWLGPRAFSVHQTASDATHMDDSGRHRWFSTAILVGVLYLAVGIAFAALAGAAASNQMRSLWRLSAFAISAVVFAAHIADEHFRLRNTVRPTAWHASVSVAIGAFALALQANIHDLGSAAGYRPRMLIALVAWPLLTAVPAFVVALVAAAGPARTRPRF